MDGESVLMRDSANENGPVLAFDRDAWTHFTHGVRDGEFD